jgi:hypothetical protein
MATQQITPYQAGYEYAYLNGSLKGQDNPTMDIENTLKTPFKNWLGMDSNWTRGFNQYAKDVNIAMDEGSNISNNQYDKFGPNGPIGFIYKKKGGKKSKRRGAQKKRKTRRSRK